MPLTKNCLRISGKMNAKKTNSRKRNFHNTATKKSARKPLGALQRTRGASLGTNLLPPLVLCRAPEASNCVTLQ